MSGTMTPQPGAAAETQTPAPQDPLAEARAMLEAANAAAAAAKAERERLEAFAAEQRKVAETKAAEKPAAPDSSAQLAELRQRLDYIRKDEIVAHVKAMGFGHDWPAERILRFAPDVDPRTQEGKVALEAFRQANLDLFAKPAEQRKPMLDQMVEGVTKRPGAREHEIFSNAYIAKVFERNFKEAGR